jgi:hypothetical protein
MATLKYWVRYQTGSPISNIGWNTSNVDHIFNVTTQSGITSIPINTWYQIADSNIDESLVSQSYFDVYSELQYNPAINAAEVLCSSNLSITASIPSTISLDSSNYISGSYYYFLSGSITGSYIESQWYYNNIPLELSGYATEVSFSASGSYTYTLTANDVCGNTVSSSVLIIVPPIAVPYIINSTSSIPQYSTMSYQITASNNPNFYSASSFTAGLKIITTDEKIASQSLGWNGNDTLILNTTTGLIQGIFTSAIPIGNYNINLFSTNLGGVGSGSLLISIISGLGYSIFGASAQRWSDSQYGLPYYNSGGSVSDLIGSNIPTAFPLASNGTYIQNSTFYSSSNFGISLLPVISDAFQLSANFSLNSLGFSAGSYNWGFALLDSNNKYMVGTEMFPSGPSGSNIQGCNFRIGYLTDMSSIASTNIPNVAFASTTQSISTPTPVSWSMKNGIMNINFLGKSASYNFGSIVPGRLAIYTQDPGNISNFVLTSSIQFSNISVISI